MSKINDLTISVTLNGSELERNFRAEDLSKIEAEKAVTEMIVTLVDEDKHEF